MLHVTIISRVTQFETNQFPCIIQNRSACMLMMKIYIYLITPFVKKKQRMNRKLYLLKLIQIVKTITDGLIPVLHAYLNLFVENTILLFKYMD